MSAHEDEIYRLAALVKENIRYHTAEDTVRLVIENYEPIIEFSEMGSGFFPNQDPDDYPRWLFASIQVGKRRFNHQQMMRKSADKEPLKKHLARALGRRMGEAFKRT